MTSGTTFERVHRLPPVAGMPLEYRVAPDIRIASPDMDAWAGTRATDETVVVDHVLGDCRVDGLDVAIDSPPWSTYYRDGDDGVVVRFHGFAPKVSPQLLRATEPGRRYEVRYAEATVDPAEQRGNELALFALVLADRRRGTLAHGCGFVLPGGPAVLCLGRSGAGKSTLARLLEGSGTGCRVMNDDRIILTDEGDGFRAWGAPWPGEGGIARAIDAPLGALAFLRHGTNISVRELRPIEATRRLYETIALPLWSGRRTAEALERIDRLVAGLPLLEFTYPPTTEAARVMVGMLKERL